MSAIIAFFLSPLGRYIGIGLVALAAVGGVYTKGRIDGRAAYKAKIERDINNAINAGSEARQRALDELNAGRVPDEWLRD